MFSSAYRSAFVIAMGVVAVMALVLIALVASADAPPGPFSQGFETDTSGWLDSAFFGPGNGHITRQPSAYSNAGGYADGIASAVGSDHARLSGGDPCDSPPVQDCAGPFTRWGGYSAAFPIGGYRTQVDIYLDVAWASTHPDGPNNGLSAARFDFSSSISDSAGGFLRDFVFNAGTNPAGDSSAAGFYINASTNTGRANSFPENTCPSPSGSPNVCRTPAHITTSGWYTFRQTFRDDSGSLAVDFEIFPLGNSIPVASWTVYSGDAISTVGGNRYGWFANEEIPDLAIDDSQRTGLNIALTPGTATNPIGTSHTVTATVTSTDASGHPSPGPGVAIEFDVTAGPNTGQTSHPINSGTCSPSNCTTAANGVVSWTYTSNGSPGTDTIQACFPDRPAVVKRTAGDEARQCHTVTKEWVTPTPSPTPVVTNSPTPVVTNSPTPVVTNSPTPVVTNSPTPVVTNSPTPVVTNSPTPVVTNSPTPVVTNSPTPVVTNSPTPSPTVLPGTQTPAPTGAVGGFVDVISSGGSGGSSSRGLSMLALTGMLGALIIVGGAGAYVVARRRN